MQAGVLVVSDIAHDTFVTPTLEVMSAARQIAAKDGGTVTVLILGHRLSKTIQNRITQYGADRLLYIDDPVLANFNMDSWLLNVQVIAEEISPKTILIPQSLPCHEIAPRLASRLDGAAVTLVSGIETDETDIAWIRPCYGGKIMEVVTFSTTPVVATIAPKSFDPATKNGSRSTAVERRTARTPLAASQLTTIKRTEIDSRFERLESADVIVAGGRGLGGAHGFDTLRDIAASLGGAVGATRVACDLGWCEPDLQVGLSGRTVAPQLYLAIGISGASHHLAGCANSKVIVAVNNDPEAEIFTVAHLGVVADCLKILPLLSERLQKRTATIKT